jgi:hypothetical protein
MISKCGRFIAYQLAYTNVEPFEIQCYYHLVVFMNTRQIWLKAQYLGSRDFS